MVTQGMVLWYAGLHNRLSLRLWVCMQREQPKHGWTIHRRWEWCSTLGQYRVGYGD